MAPTSRSSALPGARPSSSRRGHRRGCRRRPSGNGRLAEASRAPDSRGATSPRPRRSPAYPSSAPRQPTRSGSPISRACATSGAPTGSPTIITSARPRRIPRDRRRARGASAVAAPGVTPTRGAPSHTAPRCHRISATPITASVSPETPDIRLPLPVTGAKMAPGRSMTGTERSVLREGIVAGVIGAVVVAVWFLLVDTLRGHPLETPMFLGAALFFGVKTPVIGAGISLMPVLGYTVVHGFAFVAFGIIAAAVIAATEREPALVIAVVILFACFETFFLGVVSVLGRAVQDVLVWWEILIANLLAATAMLWYFLLGHRSLPRILVGSWANVLREGVVAGLLGASVVAAWFLAVDTIQGEPLRTPHLLGTTFLRVQAGAPAVIAYTIVHGVAFGIFGIVAAILLAGAEREPMLVFGLVMLFTAFEIFSFGAIVIGAKWLLDELAGWTIFVGNVLASVAMLGYFFTGHRGLARRMTAAWVDDD